MKIGILKADSVLEQFQPDHGDYPDMFVRRLGDNALGEISFATYDVEHGQYPQDLDECDAYVITGSKKSVYDPEQWIFDLQDYVILLHQAKKPLAGICFGHQLVAQALGGKTEPANVGWGVGVQSYSMSKRKPYMQPALDDIKVLASHKDQVTLLPEGAELLASSDFCPHSMFQVADHIFCMQAHPEFRPGYSQDLIHMRRELIGEETFQSGVASLAQAIDSDVVATWVLQFLGAAAKDYAAVAD